MPELPEVETIRRQIMPSLPFAVEKVSFSRVSKSIVKIKKFRPVGMVIQRIERKGKMMCFVLSEDHFIISHFGMSGGWRISDRKITEKHTHVQLSGQDAQGNPCFLAYVDPRRFGNMYFVDGEGKEFHFNKLGADISSKEFTAQYIFKLCQKYPKRPLKPFLLEQKFFAGVGNYIASEICARAGVLPHRENGTITLGEAKLLVQGTKSLLKDTIKNSGTTFSGGYADAAGNRGNGVQNLVVFYQTTCGLCSKTEVIKTQLGGRGTYHCPHCQH